MHRYRLALIFLAAIAFSSSAANGAITYDLVFRTPGESGEFTSEVSLRSGETLVGVELLLIERVTGSSVSILGNDLGFAGAGGVDNRFGNLSDFAADLSVTGSDGSFTNLETNTIGGVPNTNLTDDDTIAYTAGGTFFDQPGMQASFVATGVLEVSLGTVDIVAPTVGQSTYNLADIDVNSPNFRTFGVGSLETAAAASGGSFNSGILTVSAIPEPSSFFGLGFLSLALTLRRRRNSR